MPSQCPVYTHPFLWVGENGTLLGYPQAPVYCPDPYSTLPPRPGQAYPWYLLP